jgi:hypothetical protein
VYLVERTLPGVTLAQLSAMQQALRDACATARAAGTPVCYRRSIIVPGESRCLCLFEAPDAARVQEVNEVAQVPYNRVVTALDLDS